MISVYAKDWTGLQQTKDHSLLQSLDWSWYKLVLTSLRPVFHLNILRLWIIKVVNIHLSFQKSSRTSIHVENWWIYKNILVHLLFLEEFYSFNHILFSLLSNYKFINGFNYKCVSTEKGGQSLKMRAVCFQTLTGLVAMIGDIRYWNLDQRVGSTASAYVLSVNRRQNVSRTAQEMCLQGQEQLLIQDKAGSNFDCNWSQR